MVTQQVLDCICRRIGEKKIAGDSTVQCIKNSDVPSIWITIKFKSHEIMRYLRSLHPAGSSIDLERHCCNCRTIRRKHNRYAEHRTHGNVKKYIWLCSSTVVVANWTWTKDSCSLSRLMCRTSEFTDATNTAPKMRFSMIIITSCTWYYVF